MQSQCGILSLSPSESLLESGGVWSEGRNAIYGERYPPTRRPSTLERIRCCCAPKRRAGFCRTQRIICAKGLVTPPYLRRPGRFPFLYALCLRCSYQYKLGRANEGEGRKINSIRFFSSWSDCCTRVPEGILQKKGPGSLFSVMMVSFVFVI